MLDSHLDEGHHLVRGGAMRRGKGIEGLLAQPLTPSKLPQLHFVLVDGLRLGTARRKALLGFRIAPELA